MDKNRYNYYIHGKKVDIDENEEDEVTDPELGELRWKDGVLCGCIGVSQGITWCPIGTDTIEIVVHNHPYDHTIGTVNNYSLKMLCLNKLNGRVYHKNFYDKKDAE